MQLRSKFQPLDERLTSVRSLSLLRMAVPVKIDPMLVCYTFYYACNAEGRVVYATDQRVGVHVTPMGKFDLLGKLNFMLIWHLDLTLVHIQWDLVPESFNLGIYPLAHKRVDYQLAFADAEAPPSGVISPWSTRKLRLPI